MTDEEAFDAECQRNDRERGASSSDHTDEIEMLDAAILRTDRYTPAGVEVMRQRLIVLRAMAGYLPTKAA